MPVLLIETSTERSIVGIVENKEILFEKQLPLGLNNSKYLAPAITEGLNELDIDLKNIAYIAVGIGPGSYTGIRVGAILAKTLAFGSGIPLVEVSTLDCFTPEREGPFAVLIDAKISGVYCKRGISGQGIIRYTSDAQVIPLKSLSDILSDELQIVSPFADALKEKLSATYPKLIWREAPPDLLQMAQMAEINRKEGRCSFDGTLNLLYLRKTQAELEKQEKESSC